MGKRTAMPPAGFPALIRDVKARIRSAQARAALAVNGELLQLYWDIGRLIDQRQRQEGWGSAVIPRLARQLRVDLPEERGFSERNIGRMIAFYRAYPHAAPNLPPPVAKLEATGGGHESTLWLIPWAHHVVLLEKVASPATRAWYMEQTVAHGWSRSTLQDMIASGADLRAGRSVNNFDRSLTAPHSDHVRQVLKDPYVFGFLAMEEPFQERQLESGLLGHIGQFLVELGQGFAFVGRQVRLTVGESEFLVDLLFYHLKLRCFVVIKLKRGDFQPEFAGKMNFYLGVVDDVLRHPSDQPSIGLILCQGSDRVVAEYALRGMSQPIGVSEYELTRALPAGLKAALPTVEAIEAAFADGARGDGAPRSRLR